MDSVTVTVDSAAIEAAFRAYPDIARRHLLAACQQTAERVVQEARARAERAFTSRTGATLEGIHIEPLGSDIGFRVVDANTRMPNLPLWLEKGTRVDGHRHVDPRRFFYSAATLEAGNHERRIAEALDAAAVEAGLGD